MSSGPADYQAAIADRTPEMTKNGDTSTARVLSDGDTMWVSGEGTAPTSFPDGKTWLSGDASRLLAEGSSFGPAGAIGPVVVLRGADGATVADAGERDGVDATEYTFTVHYQDAVAAAGADQDDFTDAFPPPATPPPPTSTSGWATTTGVVREIVVRCPVVLTSPSATWASRCPRPIPRTPTTAPADPTRRAPGPAAGQLRPVVATSAHAVCVTCCVRRHTWLRISPSTRTCSTGRWP